MVTDPHFGNPSEEHHRQVAVISSLAEPDTHTVGQAVDFGHQGNLDALFRIVVLVDANGINP